MVHTGFDVDINVLHACCSVNERECSLDSVVGSVKYPVISFKNSESYKTEIKIFWIFWVLLHRSPQLMNVLCSTSFLVFF